MPRLCQSGRARATGAGFTLIETLVALVIAAAGAAVILAHVRSLMLRAEREQAHQFAVLRLLNDSLRLVHGGAQAVEAPRLEKDRLVIVQRGTVREALLPVLVRNFSPLGETLPAVGLAYTPFQVFSVERDIYALHRIGPALPPPQGAAPLSAETLSPEMLQTPSKSPAPAPAKPAAAGEALKDAVPAKPVPE
jgi:prepilin-type N-terminal cleavage/methylation domain-containing protein